MAYVFMLAMLHFDDVPDDRSCVTAPGGCGGPTGTLTLGGIVGFLAIVAVIAGIVYLFRRGR